MQVDRNSAQPSIGSTNPMMMQLGAGQDWKMRCNLQPKLSQNRPKSIIDASGLETYYYDKLLRYTGHYGIFYTVPIMMLGSGSLGMPTSAQPTGRHGVSYYAVLSRLCYI